MKNIMGIFFITLLLLSGCGKRKEDQGKEYSAGGLPRTAPERNEERIGKISVPETRRETDAGFFKGGITERKGKKFGVYIVAYNDSVWIIAEKVVRDYLKQPSYGRTDIGNWFYKINLANFATNFGGIKDDLKAGEKILIPLD